jgi:hypothetical protein
MRTLRTIHGEPLYKKAKAKIFLPGNQKHMVKEMRAPAGRGFKAEAIDKWLKDLSELIDKQFEGHEYRLVPLGETSFNFVWERAIPLEVTEPGEVAEAIAVSA